MHYTVFVTRDLLLCGGGHTREGQEVKRAAKLNCFYKSVSHYAFRVQISKQLYSIQAEGSEIFGESTCKTLSH